MCRSFHALTVIAAIALAAGCGLDGDDSRLGSSIEVVRYAEQPMVVDLLFTPTRPVAVVVVDPDDAGVVSEQLEPAPDGRARVRVRALTPAATHELELILRDPGPAPEASDADRIGDEERHPVVVETGPALPGFISSFPVTVSPGASVSPDYRLFDLSVLFANEPTGAFVVDPAGVTRWYSGALPRSVGLSALWTGLSLREDGSLLLVRDDAALVLDELGHEQVRVEASALGVPGFHHDIIELPNGNFVALSLSFREVDYGPEGVLPVAGDLIVEFSPQGQLIWTWDSFDHLDTARRVADFWGDFVYVDPATGVEHHDWTHGNALVYAPARDELLISMRHQDWVLAIDHGSGEVAWALGPGADFELDAGTWFWHQHSPQWQPDGTLLLYDNGIGDPELALDQARSRVVRYSVDRQSMRAAQVWQGDSAPFLSTVAGDADRCSTGAVLALDSLIPVDPADPGAGAAMRIRELDPGRAPMGVWTLDGPQGSFSYRAVPLERLVGQRAASQ